MRIKEGLKVVPVVLSFRPWFCLLGCPCFYAICLFEI